MTGAPKQKFAREIAMAVAAELCRHLKDCCEPGRMIVAGSLRRQKQAVGDVEIVYVPRLVPGLPNDFFSEPEPANCVDARLAWLMEEKGVLIKRPNTLGNPSWGPKNKYATHVATGVPVDLFSTTEDAWFNYLVCRTGSAENNVRISAAAQAFGWAWHPYKTGFTDAAGNVVRVNSEQDVYRLAGLPYLEPAAR